MMYGIEAAPEVNSSVSELRRKRVDSLGVSEPVADLTVSFTQGYSLTTFTNSNAAASWTLSRDHKTIAAMDDRAKLRIVDRL